MVVKNHASQVKHKSYSKVSWLSCNSNKYVFNSLLKMPTDSAVLTFLGSELNTLGPITLKALDPILD